MKSMDRGQRHREKGLLTGWEASGTNRQDDEISLELHGDMFL